jgi:trk system potassium uptake protein TrkA
MKGSARVAVLGLGDYGYHFACELHALGHEVLAVDSEQDRVQQILPHVSKAAVADVSDRQALEELGIGSFDIVAVCVGERFETAVLLVHYLHQLQTPRVIVKVTDDEQAEIVRIMGATDVIHPEHSTARKTALLIHYPRAMDYLELGGGQLVVAGHPPRTFVGQTVSQLELAERFHVTLVAVWRPDQPGPAAPPVSDRPITETDVLILAGHIDDLRELKKLK